MTARARDGVAITTFLLAAVMVRLAWAPLGPWVSLGIAFASALVVAATYHLSSPPQAHHGAPPAPAHEAKPPVLLRQD